MLLLLNFLPMLNNPFEEFNQLRQKINLQIISWLEQQKINLAASNTSVTVKQA